MMWRRTLLNKNGLGVFRRQMSSHAPPANRPTPMATDNLVKVTFVDYRGDRHELTGFVGMTLPQVCQFNGSDVLEDDNMYGGGLPRNITRSDKWTEEVFGEDLHSSQTHVVVAEEWFDKLPKMSPVEDHLLNEMQYFEKHARTAHSRIGAAITLTRDLDGLVVHVPDPLPHETL